MTYVIAWIILSLVSWFLWLLLMASVPTTVTTPNKEAWRAAIFCAITSAVIVFITYSIFN